MNSWYILHSWPTGSPGGVTLTVNGDSGTLLAVCGSTEMAGLPARVELGDYRVALPDGEADSLHALVQRALRDAKPPGPMRPGTLVRRLESGRLGEGASESASLAPGVEQPAAVAECDSSLTQLATVLLDHPYAVVRGAATCAAPRRDAPLDVSVSLESVGSAAVTIAHPLAGDAADLPVRLTLQRDVPVDQRTPDDTVYLTLARGEAGSATRGGEVTLAPGEKLVLRLQPRRHLHLSPGAYTVNVAIDLAAPGGDPARATASGSLFIPAGAIEIGAER